MKTLSHFEQRFAEITGRVQPLRPTRTLKRRGGDVVIKADTQVTEMLSVLTSGLEAVLHYEERKETAKAMECFEKMHTYLSHCLHPPSKF